MGVTRDTEIQDFYGAKMKVDVAVKTGKYSIALKKNETGTYDMIADWWGVRGEMTDTQKARMGGVGRDEDLQNFILRTTVKHAIVSRYRREGYRAEIVEDEKHNINVRLTKF